MKLQSTMPTGQARTLAEIKQALLKEFKKPKSESQYITELKEIKQVQTESVWDYDQRFKDVMGRLTFQIPDQQHQEWFIAGLLPHIHRPLIQQKVASQPEALEIAMKLESSPVGDSGGMVQVQMQLVALTIQLEELTKGKEKCEQVWCTKCRTEGHHKDECPTFMQYLVTGALNPLLGGGYCEICKKWGHHPTECPLLQKYQSTPKNLFCNFCKSVGHEEKDCRAFDLMREHTSDMYRIQEENVAAEVGGPQYNNQRGFNQGNKGNFGRGRGRGNFGRGGRGPIICYNCNQPGHLAHDCQNPCMMCTYCRALDHSTEDCPQLVVKWQARGNQNLNLNQNVQMISTENAMKDPE
jgi:hypothetical protein